MIVDEYISWLRWRWVTGWATCVQTVIRAVNDERAIINFVGINRSAVSDDSIRKERRSQGVAERLFLLC